MCDKWNIDMPSDERFMRAALVEARTAAEQGEVPIGAVVVYDGEIIARAHNRRELDEDPSAHAEFSAMVEAARVLGRWRLTGCTVYVTLEPCLMCAGLMVNARVSRCVYGAADPKAGALGTLYDLSRDARLNHSFSVTAGVFADECAKELSSFFARLRNRGDADNKAHDEKRDRAFEALTGGAAVAPDIACTLPAPRVVLAMDSFKGSATSAEVEAWAAEGILRACPAAQVTCVPIADGGEGTLDALAETLGGEFVHCETAGPLGESVQARYLLVPGVQDVERESPAPGPIAVIEMAEAAGLAYSPRTHAAALAASTYGVGELLLDATARGARTVYFAIGGSATNDGGAGLLQALGAQLLDVQGEQIVPGLAGLEQLERIDLRPALDALCGCELVILSDVDNPLVGRRGALAMYGRQKGLLVEDAGTDEESVELRTLEEYDRWMVAYGRALDDARAVVSAVGGVASGEAPSSGARQFRSVLNVPGAGAAGGLGAALLALGAHLSPGIDAVLDLIGFDQMAHDADVVITGEGFMDEQTAHGKAPVGVAARAHRQHIPVVALVGGRADDLDKVYDAGIDLVLPIARRPMSVVEALCREETRANLHAAGEAAMRAYLLRS